MSCRFLFLLLCLSSALAAAQGAERGDADPAGDVDRGRLVFGQCRTCHYPDPAMGHNNGPNLYRIFGRVAGKQPGFAYYSQTFKQAQFVWTPALLDRWLAEPLALFPDSTMMSLGVPDARQRADLIAYLKQASVRDYPEAAGSPEKTSQNPVTQDTANE